MTSLTKSLQSQVLKTGEALQGVYSLAGAATYKTTTGGGSSFDPFASKSNKFAESAVVNVQATVDCFVVFGASDVADATDSFFRVTALIGAYFKVNANKPYMRMIDSGVSGTAWVTEIN